MVGMVAVFLWRMLRRERRDSMFPTPIAVPRRRCASRYCAAVAVALALWLLPLLAVALTSIRSVGGSEPRQRLGLAAAKFG